MGGTGEVKTVALANKRLSPAFTFCHSPRFCPRKSKGAGEGGRKREGAGFDPCLKWLKFIVQSIGRVGLRRSGSAVVNVQGAGGSQMGGVL